MPKSEIAQTLQFALSLSDLAERQILRSYRNCTVSLKPDGSEVTEADRSAEQAMREVIATRYPDHLILGEEFGGPSEPTSSALWVLDPIDGTTSFALGLPLFGTLIGYVEAGEPVVGVAHFPAMGETVFAGKGLGCWVKPRGGVPRRVTVSGTPSLKDAFVSACGVASTDIHPEAGGRCHRLSALVPKPRKFRFITDCVQHTLVAQGRIDAAIDFVMRPWDIAALVPCVEEAGGTISDLSGRREGVVWSSSLLSSASPSLHCEIVNILNGSMLDQIRR